MKRKSIIVLTFSMLYFASSAQTVRDRLFFGGSFGLSIGSYTDIELSPHVGYYITNRWAAGVGITYEYYNNRYHWITAQGYAERFECHIYGGRVFTNYVIVHDVNDFIPLNLHFRIFAHVEDEVLSYPSGFFEQYASGRKVFNNVLVGPGLRFPMGRRSSMNLTFLWSLNGSRYNFYGNGPTIRMSMNF